MVDCSVEKWQGSGLLGSAPEKDIQSACFGFYAFGCFGSTLFVRIYFLTIYLIFLYLKKIFFFFF